AFSKRNSPEVKIMHRTNMSLTYTKISMCILCVIFFNAVPVFSQAGWSDWEDLGGPFIYGATPAVTSWGANRLDVFARSASGTLYHTAGDGVTWSDWEVLGGPFVTDPSAVSWGPNRLDVFALGPGGVIYHRAGDGVTWTAWEVLGGPFVSAPV